MYSKRGISCSDLRKSALLELCDKSQDVGLEAIKPPDDYNSSIRKRQTAVVDGITVQLPNAQKLERKK